MLSHSDIQLIEDEAVESFVSKGLDTHFEDEIVDGYVPYWYDVDKYKMAPASCTVPGDIISDWIYGDFWSIIDKYLKTQDAKNFYDLADTSDLQDSNTYMEFCLDQCQNAEDMFWEFEYQKLCLNYLQEHGEF